MTNDYARLSKIATTTSVTTCLQAMHERALYPPEPLIIDGRIQRLRPRTARLVCNSRRARPCLGCIRKLSVRRPVRMVLEAKDKAF